MINTDAKDAARLYRERSIEGAGPTRIIRLLLEGAVRRIDTAAAADASDPLSTFVADLTRADEIVAELALAIDAEKAPELSQQTLALYEFVGVRLRESLGRREIGPALEGRAVLARLTDAWQRIDEGRS
jgi:flagellar biosynthetic protein FliS